MVEGFNTVMDAGYLVQVLRSLDFMIRYST